MADAPFNADGLVRSDHYAGTMNDVVLPWLAGRRTDATVAGEGGVPLFCSRFDADKPRGTVLIVHGFTENAEKYDELIHSLLRSGYSVVAYDQRGHGRSWRDPAISDISLTHVNRFGEYVADLKAVCDGVLAAMPKPWLLFRGVVAVHGTISGGVREGGAVRTDDRPQPGRAAPGGGEAVVRDAGPAGQGQEARVRVDALRGTRGLRHLLRHGPGAV